MNLKNQQPSANLSPNLLDRELILRTAHYTVFIKTLKKLNFFLIITFFIVVALNIYINHRLDTLASRIPVLYAQMTEQSLTFEYVTYLNNKITLYKQIIESHQEYRSYVTSVIEARFPGVEYVNFEIQSQKATLDIFATESLNAALLISRLFSYENIAAVTITAAEFDASVNVYKVSFELEFN